MANKVTALPGVSIPTNDPVPELVSIMERMLNMAKTGELQSFIGTGFTASGDRATVWCDTHPNVYEMRGSLAWLESEYVHRRSGVSE